MSLFLPQEAAVITATLSTISPRRINTVFQILVLTGLKPSTTTFLFPCHYICQWFLSQCDLGLTHSSITHGGGNIRRLVFMTTWSQLPHILWIYYNP